MTIVNDHDFLIFGHAILFNIILTIIFIVKNWKDCPASVLKLSCCMSYQEMRYSLHHELKLNQESITHLT